jgi:hypothetical protein
MDSYKINRDLIKLKAKAIKAVLKGERGPKFAKIRIRYIRWVFRYSKDEKIKDEKIKDKIIPDQKICKKVWKEIANKSGGRCLGDELKRKRIRIREIRWEINRKLHGYDLNSINQDIPLYIERIRAPISGLRLIVFDHEKIQSAMDEDRKKMGIKATVLSKADLDDNIIEF